MFTFNVYNNNLACTIHLFNFYQELGPRNKVIVSKPFLIIQKFIRNRFFGHSVSVAKFLLLTSQKMCYTIWKCWFLVLCIHNCYWLRGRASVQRVFLVKCNVCTQSYTNNFQTPECKIYIMFVFKDSNIKFIIRKRFSNILYKIIIIFFSQSVAYLNFSSRG